MKRQSPEADLQIAIVQWFHNQFPNHIIQHTPNENQAGGNKIKSINYNRKMALMGSLKGFPDLTIVFNGKMFCIELKATKRRKDGTIAISNNQEEVHTRLKENGIDAFVENDFDECVDRIYNYITDYKLSKNELCEQLTIKKYNRTYMYIFFVKYVRK